MGLHTNTEIGQLKEELRRLEHKVRALSHTITVQVASGPGRGGVNIIRTDDAAGRQELSIDSFNSPDLPKGAEPAVRELNGRIAAQARMIQQLINDNENLHLRLRAVQLSAVFFGTRLQALESRAGQQGRA